VGYRWLSYGHGFKASFLYSLLDVLSVKPPPWKAYKYFKKDYNLLHIKELGQYGAFEKAKHRRDTESKAN